MKSAAGPLLFLRACRIHSALGLTTENPPCGRDAEGTSPRRIAFRGTMGPEPMPFRDKLLGAIRLRHGSLRLHYGSSQLSYGSVTPCYAFCYGSVPTNPEIRLIRVTERQSPSGSLICGRVEVGYREMRKPSNAGTALWDLGAEPLEGAREVGRQRRGELQPLPRRREAEAQPISVEEVTGNKEGAPGV